MPTFTDEDGWCMCKKGHRETGYTGKYNHKLGARGCVVKQWSIRDQLERLQADARAIREDARGDEPLMAGTGKGLTREFKLDAQLNFIEAEIGKLIGELHDER